MSLIDKDYILALVKTGKTVDEIFTLYPDPKPNLETIERVVRELKKTHSTAIIKSYEDIIQTPKIVDINQAGFDFSTALAKFVETRQKLSELLPLIIDDVNNMRDELYGEPKKPSRLKELDAFELTQSYVASLNTAKKFFEEVRKTEKDLVEVADAYYELQTKSGIKTIISALEKIIAKLPTELRGEFMKYLYDVKLEDK